MQEIGLPCSVITSHGEPSQNYSGNTTAMVLEPMSYSMSSDVAPTLQPPGEEGPTLSEVAVFEVVSMKVWPQQVNQHNVILQQSDQLTSRKRKLKRPYSPVIATSNKKLVDRKRNFKKLKRFTHTADAVPLDGSLTKPAFSCDKCKSPYVVNPARTRLPNSRKKNHRPRKAIDPVTKKRLLLCNACGLAMSRPKKEKQKKVQPPEDAKRKYLEESVKFGATLAESLQEPDADRLYCPSFKLQPCRCLQNYITDKGGGESQKRAEHLLSLLKDAKNLSKQKNNPKSCQELPEELNETSGTQVKIKVPTQRGLLKRKSQIFEDFVLNNRLYLRNEIGLCERACQKVLMYSNNFLHKQLKSSPDKGPRIQRVSGKNARGLLKPISQLANETCCSDKCVMLASTHSKLLESWRLLATLGQREARRVLAEMLTPSGGTKANCYKFISMITGCSPTTICLVNEQMRRTQGDREPPEHGLKRWWRHHAKEKGHLSKPGKLGPVDSSVDEDDPAGLEDILIPTQEELQLLDPQEASKQLQVQRHKLLQLKKQLARQQQQIVQQEQKLQGLHQPVPSHSVKSSLPVPSDTSSQQLLHILEIPASTPSVITSVSDSIHSQPSISVMTASGEFEPLANISVSLAGSGQTTFSNVVILPESVLEAPVLNQESAAQGAPSLTYTSNVVELESGPATQPQSQAEFSLVPAMFPAGNKDCCDLTRLYYLDT